MRQLPQTPFSITGKGVFADGALCTIEPGVHVSAGDWASMMSDTHTASIFGEGQLAASYAAPENQATVAAASASVSRSGGLRLMSSRSSETRPMAVPDSSAAA